MEPSSLSSIALVVLSATVSAELEGLVVEPVVVTGSRVETILSDSPVAVEVIGRQEIEESGAENLAELLEDSAGIQVVQQIGRGGIQIQGLDPQYTLILVDGQRAAGRVNGTLDLNRFPVERIERVEIVKGASSALYGADALGGVVNIITRRSKKPLQAEAHAVYGSFNMVDASATVGSSGERYNVRVSGGYHRADPFQIQSANRPPGDPSTSGPGFDEGNGDVRLEYDVSEDHRLILRGDYLYRNATSVAATPLPQRDGTVRYQTFDQTNRTENYSVALTQDLKLRTSEPARVQLTAYFNGWNEQFLQDVVGVPGDQTVVVEEQLGQLTAQYDELMAETHMVTAGTELLFERLEANDRVCRPLAPGGCLPGSNSFGQSSNDALRVRWSGFLQDEWELLPEPRLVVVPGIRVDVDSQFGTYPTPKLTVRMDPIEALVLRATYGFGFRAPSFRELYVSFTNPAANYNVGGNADLQAETSRNLNLGVELRPWKQVQLQANFFRNDLTNLIDFVAVRPPTEGALGLFQYDNIGEATTQGLESLLTVTPWAPLTLTLGYMFLDARNDTLDQPLVGRAKHRVDYKLRFEERWWTDTVLYARGQWLGPRPFPSGGEAPEDIPEGPAYTMFDLRLVKHVGEVMELFVGVDNLLEAQDAQFLLIRPRTFYGGVTGRL